MIIIEIIFGVALVSSILVGVVCLAYVLSVVMEKIGEL